MPLFDHLHELRAALVKSILTVLVLFIIAMVFSNQIINIIKQPLMDVLPVGQKTIYFTGPMDVFVASLKVAMLASMVFGAPVWSYQFWKFLEPALYPTEKRYVVPFAVVSILLFFSGVLFCYYVMLPMTLQFAIGLGVEVGTPMVTINDYISMVTLLLIVFGLAFETPVILVLLSLLDLVDAPSLSKHRSVIIVGILIVAAVLTPPDPISQVAMALPMYVLYEISIIVIRMIGKKNSQTDVAVVEK